MKRLALTTLAVMMVGSIAIAAENEASEKATVDKSKNPITGTETTTRKYNRKMKDAAGNDATLEVTEKTKVKRDGTVKQTVEAEGETTSKP